MDTSWTRIPLTWKAWLVVLFLLGLGLAVREKLDRRRTEHAAIRALLHAEAPKPVPSSAI